MKSFYFTFFCATMLLLSNSSAVPTHNIRDYAVQFITSEDDNVDNIAEELKVFSIIYCGLRKSNAVEVSFSSARYEYKNAKDKYKFEVNKIFCDFQPQ